MAIARWSRALARRERGQVLIIFVLLIVPVSLVMGVVAVDASMWQSERRGAQKDADLAALAGGYELLKPAASGADAIAAADQYRVTNDESGNSTPIAITAGIDCAGTAGARPSRVKVDIKHKSRLFFGDAFGLSIPEPGAHACAHAGSVVSRTGLRPYAIESSPANPACLAINPAPGCIPSKDSDCFVAKVVAGHTVMVPKFGSVCLLQDGKLDRSSSTRGLINLGQNSGDACSSNGGGAAVVKANIKLGSGATCQVGDTIVAKPGQASTEIDALQVLLAGGGAPPVADGADCDVKFTVPAPGIDHAGIDDPEEVLQRIDGGPPGPSPDGVYQLRDCTTPRLIDIVVIGNFATDPTIKAFAAMYILGCSLLDPPPPPAPAGTPPTDTPNKCASNVRKGQQGVWGIFYRKLDLGGDTGEFNEFGDNSITLTE